MKLEKEYIFESLLWKKIIMLSFLGKIKQYYENFSTCSIVIWNGYP